MLLSVNDAVMSKTARPVCAVPYIPVVEQKKGQVMALSLGVDTGGTYTDAVLIRDEETVIASAKSLTTRHDLADGIGRAVAQVLQDAQVDPGDVTLASLSTTLATNALIEGQGERVGLVLVGFSDKEMQRHGLA